MILNELRSNVDKNPKTFGLTELMKYRGDPDVFISFTAAHQGRSKIGINPNSKYATPIGVYTYPVDYVINYSIRYNELSAPFTGAGDWAFLYVVKRVSNEGVVENDTQAQPYLTKLETQINRDVDIDSLQFIEDSHDEVRVKGAKGELWNLARNYALNLTGRSGRASKRTTTAIWNQIMRHLGISQYVDRDNEGVIHSNESTQAVFFSTSAFSVLDVISRRSERYNHEIEKQIEANKFNYNAFNPHWITQLYNPASVEKVFQHSVPIMRITMRDLLLQRNSIDLETMLMILKYAPPNPNDEVMMRNIINILLENGAIGELVKLTGRKYTSQDWRKMFTLSILITNIHAISKNIDSLPMDQAFLEFFTSMLIRGIRTHHSSDAVRLSLMAYRITKRIRDEDITVSPIVMNNLYRIVPQAVREVFPNYKNSEKLSTKLAQTDYESSLTYRQNKANYLKTGEKWNWMSLVYMYNLAEENNDLDLMYQIIREHLGILRQGVSIDRLDVIKIFKIDPRIAEMYPNQFQFLHQDQKLLTQTYLNPNFLLDRMIKNFATPDTACFLLSRITSMVKLRPLIEIAERSENFINVMKKLEIDKPEIFRYILNRTPDGEKYRELTNHA